MLHEPGDRAPAPEPLRLVQRFVNTNDLEDGPDLLPDAVALGAWLREAGLIDATSPVDAADHTRAIALREAIRELAAANAGLAHDPRAADVVNEAARRAGLQPVLAGPSSSRLEPTAPGVDGALGRLVAVIHGAVADGSWARLKACERDICRWAFYDRSKNQSSHWCSTSGCGQREKNRRAYRRRSARAGRPRTG